MTWVKRNKDKVILWGVLALAAFLSTTAYVQAQKVYNGSKLGEKSYKELQGVKIEVDSIKDCQQKQRVINAVFNEKIDNIGEDVDDIKRMVEQIYINALENTE